MENLYDEMKEKVIEECIFLYFDDKRTRRIYSSDGPAGVERLVKEVCKGNNTKEADISHINMRVMEILDSFATSSREIVDFWERKYMNWLGYTLSKLMKHG